ncbi:MAG: DUF7128 family protein [Halobacteriota archaeon]
MVNTTERDGLTWYECERCGLMFDSADEAKEHEQACDPDDDEPSYLQ